MRFRCSACECAPARTASRPRLGPRLIAKGFQFLGAARLAGSSPLSPARLGPRLIARGFPAPGTGAPEQKVLLLLVLLLVFLLVLLLVLLLLLLLLLPGTLSARMEEPCNPGPVNTQGLAVPGMVGTAQH
jgi:hypothetical protein